MLGYHDLLNKYEDKDKVKYIYRNLALFHLAISGNLTNEKDDILLEQFPSFERGKMLVAEMNKRLESSDPRYILGVLNGYEQISDTGGKLYRKGVTYGKECRELESIAMEEELKILEREYKK